MTTVKSGLASFTSALYSLDETSVVKCVFKARCVVDARMQIANKMRLEPGRFIH